MKRKILSILLIIILILFIITIKICTDFAIVLDNYVDTFIKSQMISRVNEMIVQNYENSFYKDITTINRDTAGNIESIVINTNFINKINNKISIDIQKEISNNDDYFKIPLGNFINNALLSGKGPKIKITVQSIGFTEYDISSEAISAGINQTIYRVLVNYTSKIKCVAPFYETEVCLENKFIVSEVYIVGKVPEVILKSSE